jgi:uncharacterized protein
MGPRTDTFDLDTLHMTAGEARRLALFVHMDGFRLGGQRYDVAPPRVAATLDVARMSGGGYSLRLRLEASVSGPCMRCLEAAAPQFSVDAREIHQPGRGEELSSPYVDGATLDVAAWARDALALALPVQIVCREDCAGLCPVCGVSLNDAGPEHRHEPAPDPRWAKLRELRLE